MSLSSFPLVTLTLFAYQGWNKPWAFSQMGLMPAQLQKIPGLSFARLLGSGAGNGFSAIPQFENYGLLATWQNHELAESFFAQSPIYQDFKNHSYKQFTTYLQPIQSKGTWDNVDPFLCARTSSAAQQKIAVITRATLRWQHLLQFWKATPHVSREISCAPGVQFAIGLGERPWIRQATFSIWESCDLMQQFAYHNPHHKEAISKAHQDNWFKEELFARFLVLEQRGHW